MSGYPTMKVVFPAPPPTTNELTAPQRAQLLRKTKKIEQLLGTTPQLLDISGTLSGGPIHITFSAEPDSPSKQSNSGKRRFASVRSAGSRRGSIDSDSAASSSSYSSGSPLRRSTSTASTNSLSPIPSQTIPSRPASAMSMALSTGSRCNSPATFPLPRSSAPSPSSLGSVKISAERPDSLVLDDAQLNFVIPTASTVRKQKMDRLRKKLGAEVPLELVFPDAKDEDRVPVGQPQPVEIEKPSPPPAVPRSTPKKSTKRIARARDSIADAASIHRAAKKEKDTNIVTGTIVVRPGEQQQLKRKKSRASLVISGPIPGPTTTTTSSLTFKTISLAEARRRQRLSRIVESPDEDFSLNMNVLRLSRHDLSMLAAAATSMGGQDEKELRTAEWVVGTSASIGGAETKTRKRPTSYRKPVPSFLVDSDASSSEEISFL